MLRRSKTGKNLPKNKVVPGKTPLFLIGPFSSCHFICLNIGFWQSGNDVFSISVVSTKRRYSSFLKRFSFSRKFVSKLMYWKCLKLSPFVTWKHADLSNGKLFWKSLVSFFSFLKIPSTSALFVGFKMKTLRKSVFKC